MDQMTAHARELAVTAYRAGEMDFPISVAAANLAAEYAAAPESLLRAGKAFVGVAVEAIDDHTPEAQADELEALADL